MMYTFTIRKYIDSVLVKIFSKSIIIITLEKPRKDLSRKCTTWNKQTF